MSLLHAVAAAAEDTEFDPDQVTPGAAGFVFTAIMALAVILLGVALVRRLRRLNIRAEVREELEAEMAERAETAERGESGGDGPRGGSDDEGRPGPGTGTRE